MNDIKEKLFEMNQESLKWLIDRLDRWRDSIATRSSIVLSANALLLAGISFFVDEFLKINDKVNLFFFVFYLLLLFVCTCLIIISIIYATTGIANIWRTSRKMFGSNMPSRLLFHPSDAVSKLKTLTEFRKKYEKVSDEEITDAIWAEIWTLMQMHNKRYRHLKLSVRLLVISVPFYFLILLMIVLIPK